MTPGRFDDYKYGRNPSAKDPLEAGFPDTTDADYAFHTYNQPPWAEAALMARLGRVARAIEIDPNASDETANRMIVNSAAIEERKNPHGDEYKRESREDIPSTYDMASFVSDADASYVPDSLATAWLQLYQKQVETTDYSSIQEVHVSDMRFRLPRIVPRRLTDRLPDGSKAESVEIFLVPEFYEEYLKAGLLPETPGGTDGTPRIYWFERDGNGFKAGTNADRICRTPQMNPLTMANLIGTFKTIGIALNQIPTMLNAREQDEQDSLARKATTITGFNWRGEALY